MSFRKDSPKFDGVNYDSWKENMKTHFLCMALGYWMITKVDKEIIDENKLEECTEAERDLFMFNMRAREELLLALLKNEYSHIKSLVTSHEIWKDLESTFEGDKHAKRIKLQNWINLFQEAKMMVDEYVRSYICRIS